MLYKFPEIRKFSDIEQYIDPDLFYIAKKDGYKVINYHMATPETFPPITDEKSKIVREFRGIIFNDEGNIIRRPYEKFFNVSERNETLLENIDISQPHKVIEKIDGSMCAVFRVKERLIFGTKLGETDASKLPQEFAESRQNYMDFCNAIIDIGATPIFEYCSNKNRIVLDYPEENLILTGIRKMFSGEYVSYAQMKEYAGWFDIPLVKMFGGTLNQALIDRIRATEGIEGIVVRFDQGGMVKIKADAYLALHRVKSDINSEKNVVALILEKKIDDLKPLLSKDDLLRITEFEKKVTNSLIGLSSELMEVINFAKTVNRKDFALNHTNPSWAKHLTFSSWNELNSEDIITKSKESLVQYILKNCNSNKNYSSLKEIGGIFKNLENWTSVMFGDQE